MMEIADTAPDVTVQVAEYARLLGYPRDWVLEDRALELAGGAREWYARHGRAWVYAREVGTLDTTGGSILIDGTAFSSARLMTTLRDAGAHSLVVALSAGGKKGEGLLRRLEHGPNPEVMLAAALQEAATAAGIALDLEDGAIFIDIG